eukprot:gene14201-19055_t
MSGFINPIKCGYYQWEYGGGKFEVCLRPNGVFYCDIYQAEGKWSLSNEKESESGQDLNADLILSVDWSNYGKYVFQVPANDNSGDSALMGNVLGNTSNWRKLQFVREFSQTEKFLLGDGLGSVWRFEWAKGNVGEVEFRFDTYNHFISRNFPAHSHWTISADDTIDISWGQYGDYELRLEQSESSDLIVLSGSKKGQPSNWRKAFWVCNLNPEDLTNTTAHDHSHSHG